MKYFTIAELVHSDTAQAKGLLNVPDSVERAALVSLVDNVLDPLREAWGGAIRVNSGYRSQAVNKAVGGVNGSQHTKGQAADITVGSVADNRRLFQKVLDLRLDFDQMILEQGGVWVHISYKSPKLNRHMCYGVDGRWTTVKAKGDK